MEPRTEPSTTAGRDIKQPTAPFKFPLKLADVASLDSIRNLLIFVDWSPAFHSIPLLFVALFSIRLLFVPRFSPTFRPIPLSFVAPFSTRLLFGALLSTTL
jgi:hypothetical protein